MPVEKESVKKQSGYYHKNDKLVTHTSNLEVVSFTNSIANIEKFKDLHKVSVNEDKYALKIHYITLCI